MSARLDTIVSLIDKADTIADVGCDHAYVARRCLELNLAKTVIASDISEKCLDKARKLLGDRQNVRFVCCDGLKYDCDTAVIAGMGGLLIGNILLEARSKPKTVLACPHRNCEFVRETLLKLGYGIDKDIDVSERGKFYSVIRARKGEGKRELTELQLLFGLNVATPTKTLVARLEKLRRTYSVAAEHNADKIAAIDAATALWTHIDI